MSKGVDTAMKINTMKFFVEDAFKGLKRNKTLSIASMATVAATLFILGVFILLILNVNQGVKSLESKVELKVFLTDDIKINEKTALENKIKGSEGVVDVQFEDKAQALANMKKQLGNQGNALLDGLDKDNPIPASYTVKVTKPEMLSKVSGNIKDMPGIYQIKDQKDLADKISKIVASLKLVAVIMFVILFLVSLFLIGNTIKLTVYSRRREIGIMKYIGATDWFIRWPFIIEGVSIGVFGSLLSTLLLYWMYNSIYVKFYQAMYGMMQLVSPSYLYGTNLIVFVLIGIIIGSCGSMMAIRKFLAV